jgi:predicted cytidylate kinase
MANPRSIVVNGDLGSGKTTISVAVAERLGLRRVSVGDLYREMAQGRGMTALQLNLHAELDDTVDGYVDQLQREIAASGEQLVVDSRLAWFFFGDAFKVHLITDTAVAARRVLSRPSDEVEGYSSIDEATEKLRDRSESERDRFLARYGVDKSRLRNYDLVCDTTRASPGEVVDLIVAAFAGSIGDGILATFPPLLLLDPARVYPTVELTDPDAARDSDLVERVRELGPGSLDPITIGYADSLFYVIDGHRRLSAAIRGGATLVPARLLAEGDELVVDGQTAREYFESSVRTAGIDGWAAAHKIELPLPRHAGHPADNTPR